MKAPVEKQFGFHITTERTVNWNETLITKGNAKVSVKMPQYSTYINQIK